MSDVIRTTSDGNNRRDVLDYLRGLAILGMLIANVPWHVGNSMSRVIEPDTTSILAWLLQYLIFDQRFMPIFCFLFGAGFWILIQRRNNFQEFRLRYLRRMLVLFAIGVAHAYILWPGDILITYGVCGCLLLLFHKCSAAQFIVWGSLFKLISLLFGQWPALYYDTLDAVIFAWWYELRDAPMDIATAYSGNYSDLFTYNAWRNEFLQWTALPHFRIWNALGLMLIGIGLYRMGILQGEKSKAFYKTLLKYTLLLSSPLIVYGVVARIGINPTVGPYLGFTEALPLYNLTFRTGCLMGSVSILAAVHLFWDKLASRVRWAIQQVGKMAVTNYLLQSVLFILVFHTFKLFQFDSIDHDVMLLLVCGTWMIHIAISCFWLKHFRQGPVEQVYRFLATK